LEREGGEVDREDGAEGVERDGGAAEVEVVV
jgi:hypothetical protein